ncbi:DNA starvation/stationary phase protection protein [Candidatus Babeliales bacterium]|nr:DNA starvation/stationary phase protection protein [Candidatus Babeliales bacterium]
MQKNDAKMSQELLNELLANESVLLMQTLNYHWNLVGPEFHDYHLLFDKQYNQLFADMDKIAERIRAVQGQALGSFKNILATASLKEDSGKAPKPKQMIINLLKQYEALIEQIRAAIVTLDKKSTDFGTINFLEELITQHEKTAWMLRSLTEK